MILSKELYKINNNLCIRIYEKSTNTPVASLSVNKPDVMGSNQIIVKDYSDNKGKQYLYTLKSYLYMVYSRDIRKCCTTIKDI